MVALNNKVQESREDEALSRAQLARFAGVNEKTIRNVEEELRQTVKLTKIKIVNGFNSIPNKKREYSLKYLFSE